MPYQRGEIIVTEVGQPYVPNWQHRDGNPNKSQWIISESREVAVFERCYESNWISQDVNKRTAWGLHLMNEGPLVLGQTARKCRLPLSDVRIAKFVVKGRQAWHGYPANYRCNKQDRPDTKTLNSWYTHGHIRKDEIDKIRKMKPCSLSS